MSGGNMPLTQRRSRVLVITEPHNFRHFFLQVSPIQRQFLPTVARQRAWRIVNGIAPENEQLLDLSFVYVTCQSQNAVPTRIAVKLAENQRLAKILQRRIDAVSDQ